jgi:hypothetical protein
MFDNLAIAIQLISTINKRMPCPDLHRALDNLVLFLVMNLLSETPGIAASLLELRLLSMMEAVSTVGAR